MRAWAASSGVVALVLAICVAIHHGLYATASDSVPLATNVIRSATDLNWQQSPSSPLNSPGRNSVTLDACPPGVIATEPAYYVYISAAGSPETVRVTGGTCKGDGHLGTLEFTTTNSHPGGYVLSSASSGVQEASIAARYLRPTPARSNAVG